MVLQLSKETTIKTSKAEIKYYLAEVIFLWIAILFQAGVDGFSALRYEKWTLLVLLGLATMCTLYAGVLYVLYNRNSVKENPYAELTNTEIQYMNFLSFKPKKLKFKKIKVVELSRSSSGYLLTIHYKYAIFTSPEKIYLHLSSESLSEGTSFLKELSDKGVRLASKRVNQEG